MHRINEFMPFQRLMRGAPPLHPRAHRGQEPASELVPVDRDVFDLLVALRCHDHTRYEGGLALVRFGVRPQTQVDVLRRALCTELRHNDAVCRDHDGSYLALLCRAGTDVAELVAERVLIAAQELGLPEVEPMYRIAISAAGGHAMDPDTLWEHLEEAWAEQDWTRGIQLVVRRHLDS